MAVVPPMSNAIAAGHSQSFASCAAAMVPAAGPDSTMQMGNRRAAPTVEIVPSESMRNNDDGS